MCSLFVWLSLASSQTITTSRDLLFITMVPSRDSSYVSKDCLDMMEKESLIFENKMNQIIFAINMFVYMYVFVMDRLDTNTGGYCGFWIFFELKIEEVPSMQNEICGRKCLIFNILKLKYHLRSNFLKVKKIRLLADMIWALHVRLKNRSLVCGIKEVDSAGCRTCEVFEVFSLLQVSSSLRCFGMDHFEHFERRSMDRLERQTEDVKVFKNFSLETANKDEDNIIEILKRCFLQCERFIGYFSAEVSQLEKKLDLFENATVRQKSASLVQKALEFIFSESRDVLLLLFCYLFWYVEK